MHHQIELGVGLVACIIALGVLARYLSIAYPILFVLGGLVLSVLDGADEYRLNSELVLFGFLPPLLYAASFQTNWRAFRANIIPILSLAIGLVLFTATLVAWAAHDILGMSWPAGFVLGAIVSPPDVVSAVAITKRVRLPRSITTLLEGESLVNDASALVTLRIALAAAAGQAFRSDSAGIEFLTASAGGVGIGLIGGWIMVRIHRWLMWTHLGEPKLHIALSLLTPYLVFLSAERAHVSGVLAAVTTGLYLSHYGVRTVRQQWYSDAKAVWDMVEFLLNGLIFVLIGFQLPLVLTAMDEHHTLAELCRDALIVSIVVISARFLWIFPRVYLPSWAERYIFRRKIPHPSWRAMVIIAWAGMRGVVSLAAALALPPCPDHDRIVFLTFGVILVTLVGQGLTLPLVIRGLGFGQGDEGDPASNPCLLPEPAPVAAGTPSIKAGQPSVTGLQEK